MDVALTPLGEAGTTTDPGSDVATGLAYGDVEGFTELPAGTYAVSLRAAGAAPTTPPVLSTRVAVRAGGASTVAITGPFTDLGVQVLADDLSAPPPGSTRVRVLAAAGGAGTLDVRLTDGTPLAEGLAFPGAGTPVTVPAGRSAVRLPPDEDVPVELMAGTVVSLLVLDRPDGGLTVRMVVDAAGAQRVPIGAVEAGGGRTSSGAAVFLALAVAGALSSRRGRVVGTAAAAGAALAIVPPAHAASAHAASADVVPADVVPADVVPAPVAEPASPSAPPSRLSLPSLGTDSPVTPVGLSDTGALVPPADAAVAGWYTGSAVPGRPGPAVVAGHVDWAGAPGVFARLDELAVGDPVVVQHADGTTHRFAVTRVERHAKAAFPTSAVYGATPGAELRLITCGGAFDAATGSYVDNVVVFAD
ncbi:class F sortase [Blastococcus sp. PRF04-17]|nr:class F sortase [Blastococcus sp. PRF04-17]